jgi:hypothetical protein
MAYYIVKMSYGQNETRYYRTQRKHNHDAETAFVVAAKNDFAASQIPPVSPNDVIAGPVQSNQSKPPTNGVEI